MGIQPLPLYSPSWLRQTARSGRHVSLTCLQMSTATTIDWARGNPSLFSTDSTLLCFALVFFLHPDAESGTDFIPKIEIVYIWAPFPGQNSTLRAVSVTAPAPRKVPKIVKTGALGDHLKPKIWRQVVTSQVSREECHHDVLLAFSSRGLVPFCILVSSQRLLNAGGRPANAHHGVHLAAEPNDRRP